LFDDIGPFISAAPALDPGKAAATSKATIAPRKRLRIQTSQKEQAGQTPRLL
jgi:hypothetical protein